MTSNATITTTVTLADLRAAYDDELADLREGYDDAVTFIKDKWGEDALERPIPQDVDWDDLSEDMRRFVQMRSTAGAYEETAKKIQSRNHALDVLGDELDGDAFEIRMLTGQEVMGTEKMLKMKAQSEGVEREVVEHYRKGLVVDEATVDAPEGIPRDDDDSPKPSEAGSPLTLALYEAVENLNESGAADFRAPGFGEEMPSPPTESSDTPTRSSTASKPLDTVDATPDGDTAGSGDSS